MCVIYLQLRGKRCVPFFENYKFQCTCADHKSPPYRTINIAQENIPGFRELVDELTALCYSTAIYTLNAENAVTDFAGKRTPEGVLLYAHGITQTDTSSEDNKTRMKFYKWIITFPTVIIFVKSYLPEIDTNTHEFKKEIRGFIVKYENGIVKYQRAPADEVKNATSVDYHTGQFMEPSSATLFM